MDIDSDGQLLKDIQTHTESQKQNNGRKQTRKNADTDRQMRTETPGHRATKFEERDQGKK